MRQHLMLSLALLAVLAAPASARTWRETFDGKSPASVRVRSNDASVHISTRETDGVEVIVRHELKTWGWTSPQREPTVSIRRVGDEVVVEADVQRTSIVFGGISRDFSIHVTMPRRGTLSVHTDDGRIECDPLDGDIRLETGDGRIVATGLRGKVDMRSGDGRIEASGLDGSVQARTGDGRIVLEGRFDRLDTRTGDGAVTVTALRGSQVQTRWAIETNDGPVSVRIPRDLKAMLDAHTHDGRVSVDLPIQVPGTTRQSLSGQLNGGDAPLRVRTRDGSITFGLSTN